MTSALDGAQSQMRRPDRFDDRLSGVRAKIDRATHQLEALHREVQAFRHSEAYLISGKFEPERSSYVFRLRILEEPPLLWGVVIGEIAHNLRSALDQLVWQLVRANDRTPGKWNEFPVYRKQPQAGFAKVAARRGKDRGPLCGVATRAVTRIERTQPYHGGECRLLGVLDHLWNADKHRFLIPTVTTVTSAVFAPGRFVPNEDAGPVMDLRLGGFSDKYEAELAVIGLRPTGPNPKVEMRGDPPIDIAFNGGPGIVDALAEIARFTITQVFAPLDDLLAASARCS